MSAKQSIGDAVFRTKLYVGVALLGAFLAAIFYPLFLFDFPPLNLIDTIRLSAHVYETARGSWWAAVISAGGLNFWLVWMLIARPWRGGDEPPDAGSVGVKKPW